MFSGRARQLTIFFGESDRYHSQTLHAALLEMLRREGCNGATVTRGIAGFGASSVIHTSAILRLSMDLPIVITVIDRAERIERILARIKEMAPNAMITLADVEVVQSGVPFKEGLPDVKVAEVMRREVISVRPDSAITEVVHLLLDKDFTAVPVVDDQNKVIGMISDNDLLKRGGVAVTLSLKKATDPDFVNELHKSLSDPGRKVADVMTREVVTTQPDTLLGKAARLMVERHLKRLPVVDHEGKLVGILGRLDILNTIAAVSIAQWHPQAHPAGSDATVAEVMTRDVPTVHESAKLEEIFQLLVSSSHKRVVVIDDQRRVAGIIADSDLISRVSRENWPGLIELLAARLPIEKISAPARQHLMKLRAHSAKDLMTRTPVTVRQEMPVASALVISAENATKRLPVVDSDGRLVGIVGRAEMLRALLQ
jgi:CBS-domain-containing membrane protein/PII-like signaling protein